MTDTSTFTLSLDDAQEAFAAVLPSLGKDTTVPVLMSALVDPDGRILATDRYVVSRFGTGQAPALSDRDAQEHVPGMLVPRAAMEWVGKVNPRQLRYPDRALEPYTVTIESDAKTVTAKLVDQAGVVERSQAFDAPTRGSYPPASRLIDEWEPLNAAPAMAVALAPERLLGVLGWAKKFHPGEPIQFQPGKETTYYKPSPMRLELERLTMIVQPNKITG